MEQRKAQLEENQDRRVLRTKKGIHDTFLNLLLEKDLQQITVKELAERANINRKTFYSYYANIEDLFNHILNEHSDKFISRLSDYDITSMTLNTVDLFSSLNEVIFEDYELYQRLYQMNRLPLFVEHIRQSIVTLFTGLYSQKFGISENEYLLYVEYFVSGVLAMYTKWFSLDPSISLNQLTKIAGYASFNGFRSIRDHIGESDCF